MRLTLLITVFTALTITSVGGANGQTPPRDVSGSTVLLEGCLQNADHSGSLAGTPLGTSATPGNAGDIANSPELPPLFLLTDARPAGGGQGDRAVGTAGAATTHADGTVTRGRAATDSDSPKTYALVGNQDQLAEHNGQRVEVSGTIAPPVGAGERRIDPPGADPQSADNGAAGGSRSPGADNGRGSAALQSGTERLNVASIRPLGTRCSSR
jgi:hypothetical protein